MAKKTCHRVARSPLLRKNGVHKRNTLFSALLLSLTCSLTSARALQEILNDGTLRVGVALYAPWAMRGPSGELTGFEIDVARKLAEDMGVEAEFNVYTRENIILGLESGRLGPGTTQEDARHRGVSGGETIVQIGLLWAEFRSKNGKRCVRWVRTSGSRCSRSAVWGLKKTF